MTIVVAPRTGEECVAYGPSPGPWTLILDGRGISEVNDNRERGYLVFESKFHNIVQLRNETPSEMQTH